MQKRRLRDRSVVSRKKRIGHRPRDRRVQREGVGDRQEEEVDEGELTESS
jgi:hypothetical protein